MASFDKMHKLVLIWLLIVGQMSTLGYASGTKYCDTKPVKNCQKIVQKECRMEV